MKNFTVVPWILARSEIAVHGNNARNVVNKKIDFFSKQGKIEKVKFWLQVFKSIEVIQDNSKTLH